MPRNPFGDDDLPPPPPRNPFGQGDPEAASPAECAAAIEHAAARIRRLRGQIGAEGLTASGSRELMDQINDALRAMARALRSLEGG